MKTPMSEQLITVGEAARLLSKSPGMVRVYERTGKLAATKTLGGLRLFREADVRRLAEEQRMKSRESSYSEQR